MKVRFKQGEDEWHSCAGSYKGDAKEGTRQYWKGSLVRQCRLDRLIELT